MNKGEEVESLCWSIKPTVDMWRHLVATAHFFES